MGMWKGIPGHIYHGVNQCPSLLSAPCCLNALRHRNAIPVSPDVICPSSGWSTVRTAFIDLTLQHVCAEVMCAYDVSEKAD